MKTYALRIEKAESIFQNLISDKLTTNRLSAAFEKFLDQLLFALQENAVEPVKIETHRFEDLENEKMKLMQPGKNYICFDSQSRLGIPFGVSRRFDFMTSKQLGITSRPGYDQLDEQVAGLKQTGDTFGIIEDDIYTGGTIRHMIDKLEHTGIKIDHIVSGISSADAIGNIHVDAARYYNPDELLELTDPRDYIFGARNGGLVVSHGGQKLRVPYDAAFVDVAARSSIDPQKVSRFSEIVRKANIELHTSIGTYAYPARLFYTKEILDEIDMPENYTLGEMLNELHPA